MSEVLCITPIELELTMPGGEKVQSPSVLQVDNKVLVTRSRDQTSFRVRVKPGLEDDGSLKYLKINKTEMPIPVVVWPGEQIHFTGIIVPSEHDDTPEDVGFTRSAKLIDLYSGMSDESIPPMIETGDYQIKKGIRLQGGLLSLSRQKLMPSYYYPVEGAELFGSFKAQTKGIIVRNYIG